MSRATSLVSTDWVQENLSNKNVVFIEVDEDTSLYEKGHIQGAITFHWREDLQDGLIRDLISKRSLKLCFQRAVFQMIQLSFSTAAITTGSQHMRSGISRFTGTKMFA